MTGPASPIVMGLRGLVLGDDERAAIARLRPAGFMLFARNIERAEQVRALCVSLREVCDGYEPLIGVDQEGGRVQRLRFAGRVPAARAFGDWYATDKDAALEAVRLAGLVLAAQLRDVGANWMLSPVLDVACEQTHAIIGDRAFSDQPDVVAALAKAYMDGMAAAGALGCIKHLPGHGRAAADSHVELPRVDVDWRVIEADGLAFRELGHAPFAMTAHIKYPFEQALGDAGTFDGPATFHAGFLQMLKQRWGITGLLVADDIGMNALDGDYVSRILRAHSAGCDLVLCCFSKLKHGMAGTVFDEESFRAVAGAGALPVLPDAVRERLAGLDFGGIPHPETVQAAWARLHELWDDGPAALGYAWPQ